MHSRSLGEGKPFRMKQVVQEVQKHLKPSPA
jgi:hypothetical protein